jgi:hypothetical protein
LYSEGDESEIKLDTERKTFACDKVARRGRAKHVARTDGTENRKSYVSGACFRYILTVTPEICRAELEDAGLS